MKLLFFLGSGRAFADVEGIRYVSVCELGFAATDLCTSLVYDHTNLDGRGQWKYHKPVVCLPPPHPRVST